MDGILLSATKVAYKLKVSEQYARKLMRDGKIKSEQVGKSWVTKEDNYKDYINSGEFLVNPDDKIRPSHEIPEIVALSFFSGAQGLDYGFSKTCVKPILACEINKDARSSILANDSDIGLIGDIWDATPERIYEYANLPMGYPVDIIIGGPNCQPMSTAGKRKGFADIRGEAFIRYIDVIEEIRPKYFILENVRGLLSVEAIFDDTNDKPVKGGVLHYTLNRFEKMGYAVSFQLYNAANFGAPQGRERIILLGKLGTEKLPYLTPTHSENGEYGLPKWRTLRDAIGDIQKGIHHYVDIPKGRKDWYTKIPEGGNWRSLSLEDQKKAMGNAYNSSGGKSGFFRRLDFNKVSPTLLTNPLMKATDLVHPTELRPLSIEEYSRIQGFPDDWHFCGKIVEQYRQIGNAVPTQLGEAIGRTIMADIRGKRLPQYEGFKFSRYKNTDEISFKSDYQKWTKDAMSKNLQMSLTI
ncbi:DNA cytosine methyltransferase [Sporolactobacillus laevolacticus]|uniref:DNA (cytosine-5-)-methyltransferase n=1 Tax=Sporolactobacillus laevolacticus DSM 442 TaxID=1395513 RepID=V6IUX2_9BACL|nr:DNA cytosine methyltransferase [Sporolactobacillus laevolacticus]EST10902.1 DNA methyltransferase [Sporolactobacillus laevolacticus DSM 442]